MTEQKLPPMYSLTAIGVATFLGSALAAGYMLASNYTALGRKQFGLYVLWGSVGIVSALLFVPAQFVNNLAMGLAVMIGQVILVLAIANKLQGAMFTSFESMGGKYHPMRRAVFVGIGASFVLTFAFALLVVMFGDPQAPASP